MSPWLLIAFIFLLPQHLWNTTPSAADVQSSKASNYNYNRNKQSKRQQEHLANNTFNDTSMSTALPDKHLSLQMEKIPEGLVNADLSNGAALTKKDIYRHQQCRYYLHINTNYYNIIYIYNIHGNMKLFSCLNPIILF